MVSARWSSLKMKRMLGLSAAKAGAEAQQQNDPNQVTLHGAIIDLDWRVVQKCWPSSPSIALGLPCVMGKTGFTRAAVIIALLGASSLVGTQTDASAAAARPNILFAVADDMGHASAYGTRWVKTPNFDRLASKGILFLNAYTPNAKCSPSRACILTGRNPWQLEAAANHWPYYPRQVQELDGGAGR